MYSEKQIKFANDIKNNFIANMEACLNEEEQKINNNKFNKYAIALELKEKMLGMISNYSAIDFIEDAKALNFRLQLEVYSRVFENCRVLNSVRGHEDFEIDCKRGIKIIRKCGIYKMITRMGKSFINNTTAIDYVDGNIDENELNELFQM